MSLNTNCISYTTAFQLCICTIIQHRIGKTVTLPPAQRTLTHSLLPVQPMIQPQPQACALEPPHRCSGSRKSRKHSNLGGSTTSSQTHIWGRTEKAAPLAVVTDCRAYYRITPKKQRDGLQCERSRGEITLNQAPQSASEWNKQMRCTELLDTRLMEKCLCYVATSPEDIRKGWLFPSPTLLHHCLRIWWVTGPDLLKWS